MRQGPQQTRASEKNAQEKNRSRPLHHSPTLKAARLPARQAKKYILPQNNRRASRRQSPKKISCLTSVFTDYRQNFNPLRHAQLSNRTSSLGPRPAISKRLWRIENHDRGRPVGGLRRQSSGWKKIYAIF